MLDNKQTRLNKKYSCYKVAVSAEYLLYQKSKIVVKKVD
ncbi:hypothetical protein K661_02489 [Piscirickettsia salmonis LF-89 = ATCC VR-1361]|nr:hypothetical protein K661_02489 [Piscirickettsia salmonis LF-89 = ATCC VR-1361]